MMGAMKEKVVGDFEMMEMADEVKKCIYHSPMKDRLVSKIFMNIPIKGGVLRMDGTLVPLKPDNSITTNFERVVISPPGVDINNEIIAAERIILMHMKFLYVASMDLKVAVYADDEELGPFPIGNDTYQIDRGRIKKPVAMFDDTEDTFILNFMEE
jgi:hypothetical protein